MLTIRNKTLQPLRLHLPGGKVLHLGVAKTGQVSDDAREEASFKALLEAGKIEIVGESHHPMGGGGSGNAPHASTHGHGPTSVVRPKGDRGG